MLGGKFKFVDFDEIKGENAKGPYHFVNGTFSDGLESIELPVELSLVPTINTLKRGQDVHITTKTKKNGYLFSVSVNKISAV